MQGHGDWLHKHLNPEPAVSPGYTMRTDGLHLCHTEEGFHKAYKGWRWGNANTVAPEPTELRVPDFYPCVVVFVGGRDRGVDYYHIARPLHFKLADGAEREESSLPNLW